MPKYTYWRNAIVCEVYEVEAENEDKALEQLMDGCHEPIHTEWVDWAPQGGYEFESVEDELVTFLNSKEKVPA
jgi:hypothetical protein